MNTNTKKNETQLFLKSFTKIENFTKWNYIFITIAFIQIALSTLFTFSGLFGIKSTNPVGANGLYNIFGDFGSFFYFTNISNYFLAVTILFVGINNHSKTKNIFVISMTYMTITIIIYWLLISWVLKKAPEKQWWEDPFKFVRTLWSHLFSYVLGGFVLYKIRKDISQFSTKSLLIGLSFLVVWYLFALFIFFISSPSFAFYSFLNFKKPFFYKGGNIFLILIINLLIVFLLFSLPLLFNVGLLKVFGIKRVKNISLFNKTF